LEAGDEIGLAAKQLGPNNLKVIEEVKRAFEISNSF
jgi:hypothetical protein